MQDLKPDYVVASPNRAPHDVHARVLDGIGRLRLHCYAGRRKWDGVRPERIRNNSLIAGLSAAAMRYLPHRHKERARFALSPLFDHWVKGQLEEGDRLITSYAYANESLAWTRRHGGQGILDAGNSHPENLWSIVSGEHRLRGCELPPVPSGHHRRALASVEETDWLIGLSSFVCHSFIERGFPEERCFVLPRPLDLELFRPSQQERDKDRSLIIVYTGGISLRKGSPYLFEAIRMIRKKVPGVRLRLNDLVAPCMRPLMDRYSDLPLDWFPHMNKTQLAEHLRDADLYILPSLEDGLARAAIEAMGCGLPVILSENTGASDLVIPDVNGEIVPICDPASIANAALKWWDRIESGHRVDVSPIREQLSMQAIASKWSTILKTIDAAP